jgi:hypothetical protein
MLAVSTCYVITALHDTLNSKLAIIRVVTSVRNPLYLPNIIAVALCFLLFLNLKFKIGTKYKKYCITLV